jgi:hypothetical protein
LISRLVDTLDSKRRTDGVPAELVAGSRVIWPLLLDEPVGTAGDYHMDHLFICAILVAETYMVSLTLDRIYLEIYMSTAFSSIIAPFAVILDHRLGEICEYRVIGAVLS